MEPTHETSEAPRNHTMRTAMEPSDQRSSENLRTLEVSTPRLGPCSTIPTGTGTQLVDATTGHRHIDTEADGDRPYTFLGGGTANLYRFPLSKETETTLAALRTYIKTKVPAELIQDEDGDICNVEDLSKFELVTLQAKVWPDIPLRAAQMPFSPSGLTQWDKCSGVAVKWIAKKLNSRCVFILRQREQHKCSFSMCDRLHKVLGVSYATHEITLESMFDPATLIPKTSLNLFDGEILVFERDRLKHMEHKDLVSRCMKKSSIAFCTVCLQFIWDSRRAAWDSLREQGNPTATIWPPLQGDTKRNDDSEEDGDDAEFAEDIQREEEYDGDDAISLMILLIYGPSFRDAESKIGQSKSTPSPADQDVWIQLDGAGDGLEPFTDQQFITSIDVAQADIEHAVSEEMGAGAAALGPCRAIHDKAAEPYDAHDMSVGTNTWTSLNDIANTAPAPQKSIFRRSLTAGEELPYLHYPSDPTAGEPFLGEFDQVSIQELLGHAHINYPIGPPVPVRHKKLGVDVLMPPTMNLGLVFEKCSHKTREATKQGGITRKNILENAEKAGVQQQQEPDVMLSSEPGNNEGSSQAELNVVSRKELPIRKKAINASLDTPAGTIEGSNPVSVVSNVTPIAASTAGQAAHTMTDKDGADSTRSTSSTLSSAISAIYAPAPPAVFCYCRKPVNDSKMVDCKSLVCPIGRFHYDCLDKSNKLSTRGKSWMCDVCKLTNKVSVNPSTDVSSKMAFSKEEIVEALSAPGPTLGVRNPYGLGTHDPYGLGLPKPTPPVQMEVEEDEDRYNNDDQDYDEGMWVSGEDEE
ncbi:hypothetical protein EJ04DRAFT_91576 [Polyplosphaeria fusca]|uniref:Zinc finger PHD-type domain-containing protein n=1 Tax=Polyplosphaeria fusca TaxID=682080 RepID=A0A9P4QPA6_9PLEO|nr:hypothetical protein EJ04DRAFT_91576 [Polyplosphaeria fusca]